MDGRVPFGYVMVTSDLPRLVYFKTPWQHYMAKRGRPRKGEVRPPREPKVRVRRRAEPSVRVNRPPTCINCIAERRKCDYTRPCKRCVQRNIECIYTDSSQHEELGPTTPNPTFSQLAHLGSLANTRHGIIGKSLMQAGLCPDSNLLDHIHDAASRQLFVDENLRPLYALDGTALLLFGVIVEEMIKGEVEAIDEYVERESRELESSQKT